MKRTVLLICLLCFPFCIKAQLDSITEINPLPACGYIGMSMNVWVDPVPGANYYCWRDADGSISSSFLFDGQIGPYCTTSNSVMLTFALADSFYVLCVTAYSANDSSNTFCDTIYGFVSPLFFSPSNASLVIPNSSGSYSVLPYTGYGCEPAAFRWWITGDANINGINDTLYTLSDTITLNFGPGFITGDLCVYGQTTFNLAGAHICMTINTPVGSIEHTDKTFNIITDQDNGIVYVDFDNVEDYHAIEIYDLNGKRINSYLLNSSSKKYRHTINISGFSKGMYLLGIHGEGFPFTGKFIIY